LLGLSFLALFLGFIPVNIVKMVKIIKIVIFLGLYLSKYGSHLQIDYIPVKIVILLVLYLSKWPFYWVYTY
jgi:hypothetical protein